MMMKKSVSIVFSSSIRRRGLTTTVVVASSTRDDRVTIAPHDSKPHIAMIQLNRPLVKNSIDYETARQLSAKIRLFEQESQYLGAVLSGNGGTFCSGADLKAIEQGNYNRLEDDGDAPLGPSRMMISKPIIAAIQGYAVAGGLELASLCDMRVMEEDAIVGVFCRRWGVPLIDGGTVRLPRLIGMSRAMDWILTGRAITAKEAFEAGFANRIVPKTEAIEAAVNLAHEISSFPQECLLADRLNVYEQFDKPLLEGIRGEFSRSKHVAQHMLHDGVRRFKEKEYKKKPYLQ